MKRQGENADEQRHLRGEQRTAACEPALEVFGAEEGVAALTARMATSVSGARRRIAGAHGLESALGLPVQPAGAEQGIAHDHAAPVSRLNGVSQSHQPPA